MVDLGPEITGLVINRNIRKWYSLLFIPIIGVIIPPVYLSSFPFPARVVYNLDEEESQGGIAINLLPLLAKEVQNKGEQQGQTKAHKSVIPLLNLIYITIRFTISVYCVKSNPNF